MRNPYVPFRRPSRPWVSIAAASDAMAVDHLLTLTRYRNPYLDFLNLLTRRRAPDPFERGPTEESGE